MRLTYITEETATFCSHYFKTHVMSRRTQVPRNDDGGGDCVTTYSKRPTGECGKRFLTDQEVVVVTRHILMYCDEV